MNHYQTVCRSVGDITVYGVEQEIDEYTEDSQINTVNIDYINSNSKSPGIIAKLKDQLPKQCKHLVKKIDMGSNSNILPFHIYKFLFLR